MGLSQDDINNIANGDTPPPEGAMDNPEAISEKYRRGFKEHLVNILSTLTGEAFSAEDAGEAVTPGAELPAALEGEWLGFLGLLEGKITSKTVHLISLPMAKLMVGKIMGQDTPETLEDAHFGTLKETANNLLGAWATGLSELLSSQVKLSAEPEILDGDGAAAAAAAEGIAGQEVTCLNYNLKAGDIEGRYTLVIPKTQFLELVKMHPEYTAAEGGGEISELDTKATPGVEVEKAVFQQFEGEAPVGEPSQIELLLDVPLTVSVELGRKKLSIKEILDMMPGSLLELDKLAGEPVDLMVNGKLFARGEVVVIDENFGVRISNIVSPKERLERLK